MRGHDLAAARLARGRARRHRPAGRAGGHVAAATHDARWDADLVAIALDALVVTDEVGKIVAVNPAAAALLNVPAARLVGKLLVSHVAPAYRRTFRTNLARSAAGEHLRFACELTPRALQPVLVRAHVGHVHDGVGWVLREEADAEIRSGARGADGIERVRLGNVLEAVRDGVVVVGPDLDVLFANRPAQAMLAADLEPGHPLPDPWPTSIRGLVRELLEHDADNAEALVELDDGTAYWLRAHQSGAGAGAVLLVSDVTADERREQAERDFVANAAHELQSPLTGIANAVEVLVAGAHEDEEARLRFLSHLEREIERLSRLLTSLLVLAGAQATSDAVPTERFRLRPLLARVADTAPEGADISVLCPESLHVRGHRALLEHGLRNLVVNAFRHGSPRVLLSARRSAKGVVLVDVADFGPGLTTQERLRAFDRFYRVRVGKDGFGLGLSIVQQVARAHGGEATLHPNPRGGTIARLPIPGADA